jgi:hypothetical protein
MPICQLYQLVADSRRDHVLLRRVCPSTEQALARTCVYVQDACKSAIRQGPHWTGISDPVAWCVGLRRRPCIGKAS